MATSSQKEKKNHAKLISKNIWNSTCPKGYSVFQVRKVRKPYAEIGGTKVRKKGAGVKEGKKQERQTDP